MDYKKHFRDIYSAFNLSDYDKNEEINFVIEMITGKTSKDFILGAEISDEDFLKIKECITKRVETKMPLQYIVGQAFFMGSRYFVNSKTLIPRPETEFLIYACKQRLDTDKEYKILDIGSGSGCISIELAKIFKNAEICSVDICQETIDIAKKNAKYHKVDDRINFILSDIFENISGNFNVIVSNPPYISKSDIDTVQEDVLNFEPHQALFAKENGYYFYNKIIKESCKYLVDNGLMAFELGTGQAQKVKETLANNGFKDIVLTKDCDEIYRVVSAFSSF